MRKKALGLTIALLLILCWGAPALADGPTIDALDRDDPLRIEGSLTGGAASFSGSVQLTVNGGDATELRLLASDLTHDENPEYDIPRSSISIQAGLSFTDGQPRDVLVTVSNVTRPGFYTATLLFYLPQHQSPQDDGTEVELELQINAVPNVEPVDASRSIQLVRCYTVVDCLLARLLLPASVTDEEWGISLDNKTVQPVEVDSFTVLMRGENTHRTLRPTEVRAEMPVILPASDAEEIVVLIDRSALPSDRYQGTLRFGLEGADDPVVVSLDLSVRDGPIWPLLVVLLGIFGGRQWRKLDKPEVQARNKLLERFGPVDKKVAKVKDPEIRQSLQSQLDDLVQRLRNKEDPQVVGAELDKLELQIDTVLGLDELEAQVVALGLRARQEEIEPILEQARTEVLAGRIDKANELRDQAKAKLQSVLSDPSMGRATEVLSSVLGRLGESLDRLGNRIAAEERGERREVSWLVRLIGWLGGARSLSAEAEWVVWQLLSIVFLFVLVLAGLNSLYIKTGATFGAAGLYDYLGLLLWGFSSDVATKTLQNLTIE
jgi:hypothetical protein